MRVYGSIAMKSDASVVTLEDGHWFDHPPIEGWFEARLRAELHRQHAPAPNDRPLERLEVPVIEPLPDVARESIKAVSVHALHTDAPRGHNDGRCR
jgi:hypothetical protein